MLYLPVGVRKVPAVSRVVDAWLGIKRAGNAELNIGGGGVAGVGGSEWYEDGDDDYDDNDDVVMLTPSGSGSSSGSYWDTNCAREGDVVTSREEDPRVVSAATAMKVEEARDTEIQSRIERGIDRDGLRERGRERNRDDES